MRKSLAIFILFLCLKAVAQDAVGPLRYNPRLYHPHAKKSRTVINDRHKNLIVVQDPAQSSIILTVSDTLSLPFIDDFTYPSLRPYDYSGIYDSVVNAIGPCDTMWTMGLVIDSTFSFVQTYTYTFDTATQSLDSTPNPPVRFFNTTGFTGSCFTMGDTAYLYPIGYFDFFDSATGLLTYQVEDSNNLVQITYAPVLYLDSAPSYTKWLDNNAYQNYTSAYLPPSLGVVTFDGTGSNGQPYDDSVSSAWGIADVLTSKPLYMANYTDADSVYLSFYYQPGGLGVFAEDAVVGDSLVLQFYNGYTNNWDEIWSTTGDSIPPDTSDGFRQVIIRIPSTNPSANIIYFYNGFQFRFLNYGSLAGINNIWNLDYVRLAPNRNFVDTAISDLTFQYQFPSILKNYSEMPAEQFRGNADLSDTIRLFSANLNPPQAHSNPPATNWTVSSNQVYPTASVVLAPATNTFNADTENVVLLFPAAQYTTAAPPPPPPFDSVVIHSQAALDVNDILLANDTISHDQVLSNVLAYDDGTAEMAYGLQYLGTNKFAYDFTLNQPDSLVGYQVLFTNVNAPVQDLVFNFNLWYTLDTQNVFWADTPVWTSNNDIPLYIDSVNGYTTYTVVPSLPLPEHFYFGWDQTDVRNLQIGYDMNSTKGRQHMYVYSSTTGVWQLSTISTNGSPMIRLLLGHSYQIGSGIRNVAGNTLKVFPNPTSGLLTFGLPPDGDSYTVQVFDMLGQMGLSQTISAGANTVDMGKLDQGVYMVRVIDTATGISYQNKIVRSAKD